MFDDFADGSGADFGVSIREEEQGTVSSVHIRAVETNPPPATTKPPLKCKCSVNGSCDASYSTPWV